MTKIKLCGLSRPIDIEIANILNVDYIGFVFANNSKRCINKEKAKLLKKQLNNEIQAVGVFVDEKIALISEYANDNIIDIIQLHGDEKNEYITNLRKSTNKPIIKAYKIISDIDIDIANDSIADYILLDAGSGDGKTFNWDLIKNINREYFLAGGLTIDNVATAIDRLKPYAVDVSSSIETDSFKDKTKMEKFVEIVKSKNKFLED